jgi:hypothetical protein
MTPAGKAARDTLLTYRPPARMVVWFGKVFAAKRKAGETVSPEFERWLARWQKLQSRAATETDILTDEEWEILGEMMT